MQTVLAHRLRTIRTLATKAAIKSKNKALRAKMLFELFFQKQGITVEFVPEEGMDNEVLDWIKVNPARSFEFKGYFRDKSCIGLYWDTCKGDGMLDVSGTDVDLQYRGGISGKFKLNNQGYLVGKYLVQVKKKKLLIPAKITLF